MNQEQQVPHQEEVDHLVLRISAECQSALLKIFTAHASEANRLQLPFPVIMYFVSDATASAVYEIVKHSSGGHDVDAPKVLSEREHEFVKMIKVQMNEAWASRIAFFSNQEQMDNAIHQDGAELLKLPKLH